MPLCLRWHFVPCATPSEVKMMYVRVPIACLPMLGNHPLPQHAWHAIRTPQKRVIANFAGQKNRKMELIINLQCLSAIDRRRVPLLLRNTSKPRVPLHFQCHLIACAASSSSNSRLFSIPAPRNPTVPALITFQEIKTGTQPYRLLAAFQRFQKLVVTNFRF